MTAPTTAAPVVGFDDLERHRKALTGYCYRMLGASAEAEDAVQEALMRAWQAAPRFEGRASVRTWLFRIATNVCVDMSRSTQRRARPMDLGPARTPDPAHLADVRGEATWITPVPDRSVIDVDGDPAEVVAARDTIRLAFVAALQQLPPRQRASLVLCDVLRWPAAEVAELLECSTASVNSALQRARATVSAAEGAMVGGPHDRAAPLTSGQERLLRQYVEAFEAYDMDRLAALVHDDVVQSMPPYALWLRGREDVLAWWAGPGIECRGSRLLAGQANGCPAFAQYRRDPAGGHAPWALQVIELRGERLAAFHAFLEPADLFRRFGFPARLP